VVAELMEYLIPVEPAISMILPTLPSVFVLGNILLNTDMEPATRRDQIVSILGTLVCVDKLMLADFVHVWTGFSIQSASLTHFPPSLVFWHLYPDVQSLFVSAEQYK
jgi:hypothetical protein